MTERATAPTRAATGSASPERNVMIAILDGLVPAFVKGMAVAMPSGMLCRRMAMAIIKPRLG